MKILAVVKYPGQPARIVEDFDASFPALQSFVGGLVELVRLDRTALAVINEEGMLGGHDWNTRLGPSMPIAGPIAIVGAGQGEDFASLERMDALFAVLTLNRHAMDPTPASFEAFEELTGRPAITVTTF
jgi:hypothetical protein